MEKENIKQSLSGFVANSAISVLTADGGDKRVGTSAQLALHDTVTVKGGEYISNIRTYESVDAAKADGVRENRIRPDENGKVVIDNSYFALTTDGVVSSISLRALTSWSQLETKPTEDFLQIPAGKASDIFARCKDLKDKKLEVIAVERWEEGETHKERKQQFSGSAIAFKVVE